MLLGVHCSTSGGLERSCEEAERLQIDTFQIFSRNQRQWKAKPVSTEESDLFRKSFLKSKAKIAFSHTSYLINLAAENDENRAKSIEALKEEIKRCTALGLAYCVLHPGAAGTQTLELAVNRIADGLREVLDNSPESEVMILLENTAGQGTSVGGTFENLKMISDMVESDRLGYCFDTCHAFVSEYDIRTHIGFEETMNEFDKILGLKNLKVFHLNDSKGDFNTHLDRHEHIGHGHLGLVPFREIMQKFQHIPKVLETPKEDDWDEKNL
ncbi:MAG: deoxyribonuclease IV, partial [Bacteroidia bacterium]